MNAGEQIYYHPVSALLQPGAGDAGAAPHRLGATRCNRSPLEL